MINVAKVGDTIVCTTTQTVLGTPTAPIADAACKPLNLFGNGVASKEAIDYVVQRTVGRSVMEQWVLNANMGGSPFDVFGNPASFNIGFEHHAEKARFTPDAFLQAGLGRSPAVLPTAGKYNLDEVFGEVYLPLISPANDFVFRRFDVFARGRHVDNTVNGSFFSWSAGGRFAPIDDIEFRGNFTRSFRAPSVIELFAPVSDIRTAVPDLCSIANINAGPVPTIRHANCTAFLAKYPTATPLLAAAATVPGRSGGNAGLRNEKADSFTYGVIVQPRVLPGFSLAVDYLNIHITDPVTSLDAKTIASACFDNPDFNASDPANGNRFCSLLRRDATGQIPNDPANPAVNTTFVNGIESKFSGVQASLDYRTATDRIGIPGALALGVDLFHVRRRLVNTTGVAPARSDGTVGDPAWQAQARLRFAQERWGLYTGVNYTGKQLTSRFNRGGSPNDTREIDHLKAYATVDASLWFETANHFRMTLSATNLFDRVGQKYYGVLIPSSIVDDLGRRFSLTVEKTF